MKIYTKPSLKYSFYRIIFLGKKIYYVQKCANFEFTILFSAIKRNAKYKHPKLQKTKHKLPESFRVVSEIVLKLIVRFDLRFVVHSETLYYMHMLQAPTNTHPHTHTPLVLNLLSSFSYST